MRRNLVVYAVLILLSLPFWVAGGLSGARLLPGLPLSALMFACPALSAIIVLLASGESAEARALAAGFLRIAPAPALMALCAMPLLCLLAYILDFGPEGLWLIEAPGLWSILLLFAVFMISALGEEYLWTAYLLRELSDGNRLRHLTLVPLAYVAWHALPFFQVGHGLPWIIGQLAFSFAFRLLILAVLRLAGQRSLVAVFLHAGYNVAWQLYPGATATYNPWSLAALTLVAFALAEGLGRLGRRRRLSA